ncbi:Interferon-inducible double-stranded RNA-dependent protein kinase activator A -like protein A [Halotydeus destructor]|nr:Interferon-inducible double-stranded RNA-dependent protein kinase activator A -like protein A [Halotydeus destructor]
MMARPTKTAVSVVEELANFNGVKPVYTLLQTDGPTHDPCFTWRLTFQELNAQASAKTKKGGKQRAAHELLKLIKSRGSTLIHQDKIMLYWDQNEFENEKSPSHEASGSASLPEFTNSIGKISEFCAKLKIVQPFWDDEEHVDENGRTFTVRCRLAKGGPLTEVLETVGRAPRKQLAKHDAAAKMCAKMEELKLFDAINIEKTEEVIEVAELVEEDPATLHANLVENVTDFANNEEIGLSMQRIASRLSQPGLQNYCEVLEDEARILGLFVEYQDFRTDAENALSNQQPSMYVLHLKKRNDYQIVNVMSTCGSGATEQEGKSDAARKALEVFCSTLRNDLNQG